MANANRGLGRGLGALLGDAALQTESADSLYLPISQVESCAGQPRKHFDDAALADLADSIREHGIIQPLTVRKLASGYYQIIAGERRWRAARLAGLTQVPAIVIEADDRKAMELALIENLQREDLNPIEEAEGYKTLIETYHMTQEDAAATIGKSRPAVANAMRLLTLDESVREAVKDGRLSAGHARALLPLPAARQREAAETIAAQGLSVRQTETLVKRLTTEKKEREPSIEEITHKLHAHIAEEELAQSLGRGVKIVAGRKKGRIELDYYDMDDLNDLLDALGDLAAAQKWRNQKVTDFIHEAPPPENPKPAAPEKPTSEKERQKRVYAYIAVLFTVAFILILWSFLANHRSNQQVIDQLKGSTSMMQSTLEQNAKLEAEVKALETQVEELEQTLAETEDALSAAREEAEKYRALYEELAGEESGTP